MMRQNAHFNVSALSAIFGAHHPYLEEVRPRAPIRAFRAHSVAKGHAPTRHALGKGRRRLSDRARKRSFRSRCLRHGPLRVELRPSLAR
jgi:hypothetical protein